LVGIRTGLSTPRRVLIRKTLRLAAAALLCVVAAGGIVRADIILSASGLNATLKKVERLIQQVGSGTAQERGEAVFALGQEGDALAQLLNDEVASHGFQEKALIDLAIARTAELGLSIAYNREKEKFFYNNAAFDWYLKEAPLGPHAADAAFKIIAGEFFQSNGADTPAVLAASGRKGAFLRRYPKFPRNAEVNLMLAMDYRDVYRHYRATNDVPQRDRYLKLARGELQLIARRYAGSEQATIAQQLLRRLEALSHQP
jgi:hypothetical protein